MKEGWRPHKLYQKPPKSCEIWGLHRVIILPSRKVYWRFPVLSCQLFSAISNTQLLIVFSRGTDGLIFSYLIITYCLKLYQKLLFLHFSSSCATAHQVPWSWLARAHIHPSVWNRVAKPPRSHSRFAGCWDLLCSQGGWRVQSSTESIFLAQCQLLGLMWG